MCEINLPFSVRNDHTSIEIVKSDFTKKKN